MFGLESPPTPPPSPLAAAAASIFFGNISIRHFCGVCFATVGCRPGLSKGALSYYLYCCTICTGRSVNKAACYRRYFASPVVTAVTVSRERLRHQLSAREGGGGRERSRAALSRQDQGYCYHRTATVESGEWTQTDASGTVLGPKQRTKRVGGEGGARLCRREEGRADAGTDLAVCCTAGKCCRRVRGVREGWGGVNVCGHGVSHVEASSCYARLGDPGSGE